jgi:hypothetical protein
VPFTIHRVHNARSLGQIHWTSIIRQLLIMHNDWQYVNTYDLQQFSSSIPLVKLGTFRIKFSIFFIFLSNCWEIIVLMRHWDLLKESGR